MPQQNNESLTLMPEWLAKTIPVFNDDSIEIENPIVYAHLFGVVGDWYITSISEDHTFVRAYINLVPLQEWELDQWFNECSNWQIISIKDLQILVDDKFNKEKDIRFLIARDLYWEPLKLNSIELTTHSLNYPGNTKRVRS